MAVRIRAPKNGYNFKEKNMYRHKVWSVFAEKTNPETATVLFLPSKEGLEIPIALSYGFKEENLIAVDDCPAIIATSKWRKEYPKIRFYGNSLIRAAERIKNEGITIDAANLDLCGNISMPMIDAVTGFVFSGCLSGNSVLALTVLNGRESTAINTLADLYLKEKAYTSDFSKRLQVFFSLIHGYHGYYLTHETQGEYKSGSQKMSYGIVSIVQEYEIGHEIKKTLLQLKPDLIGYIKIKKEHRDLRRRISSPRFGKCSVFIESTFSSKELSKKISVDVQFANDVYCVFLEKYKKEKITPFLKKISQLCNRIGKKETVYFRKFDSYEDTKNLIIDTFGHDFYAGCIGRMSMDWCKNKGKAEKYLDSIDWKIDR